MPRKGSYTYNPEKGKWTHNSGGTSSDKADSPSNKSNNTSHNTPHRNTNQGSRQVSGGGGNLSSKNSSKNDSGGSVEKKYNYIEINTLEGTLNFIVNSDTIKLKPGDTVSLKGIGKHLSGKYYVKDITRKISNSGYSHTATLIKPDFGDSLKTKTKTKGKKSGKKSRKKTNKKVKQEKSTFNKKNAQRTYTVKKGESIWNIAKRFYGDGSAYTKIYDANTHKAVGPHQTHVGQVLVIP